MSRPCIVVDCSGRALEESWYCSEHQGRGEPVTTIEAPGDLDLPSVQLSQQAAIELFQLMGGKTKFTVEELRAKLLQQYPDLATKTWEEQEPTEESVETYRRFSRFLYWGLVLLLVVMAVAGFYGLLTWDSASLPEPVPR